MTAKDQKDVLVIELNEFNMELLQTAVKKHERLPHLQKISYIYPPPVIKPKIVTIVATLSRGYSGYRCIPAIPRVSTRLNIWVMFPIYVLSNAGKP